MSGRQFVPPVFEERNVLVDPDAIMWQTRFVKYFVQEMKDHPAIAAWDYGNECNCMGDADRIHAVTWTATIANAIRAEDPTRPVVSGLKYEEFVRVRMGYVGDKLMASPLNRGSGVVSSFMKADGILEVPQGVEGYEAGSEVNIRLLCPEEKLKNTVVVIGSHDPLLDELADMMHVENGDVFMSSSHVGSMGGIMAVRRGEAHAAGCHLLDTETGELIYEIKMDTYAWSSPAALYTPEGKGYLALPTASGEVWLIDGITGEILATENLGSNMEA